MNKRQRRTVGSIVSIPVDGYRVHAQILADTDMVFFDTRHLTDKSLTEYVSCRVLFRLPVNSDAILDGRWVKVGKEKIRDDLSNPVPRFIQDSLNPDKFEVYIDGNIHPSTKNECKNLDRCAVWAVNHVEDRIRDHYNGVANVWVEKMRLK